MCGTQREKRYPSSPYTKPLRVFQEGPAGWHILPLMCLRQKPEEEKKKKPEKFWTVYNIVILEWDR